jgi:hypothetical protein
LSLDVVLTFLQLTKFRNDRSIAPLWGLLEDDVDDELSGLLPDGVYLVIQQAHDHVDHLFVEEQRVVYDVA